MKTWIQLENKHQHELPIEFQADDVRYSESLVEYFLSEFTQEGDIVFDPFAGFGTSLIVAEQMGRSPFGIELDKKRVDFVRSRLKQPENLIQGDARQLASYDLPAFNFSITSPPYMNEHETENPLSAFTTGEGYKGYLKQIRDIYQQMSQMMALAARAVIEISNLKHEDTVTTLAWDIAREVSKVLHFEGEIVVNWDKYGYGYDHSYCLIFSKLT